MNAAVTKIHCDCDGCPRCGVLEGFVNIGRDHWGFCERHKYCWLIGSNLFSCWREENDAAWKCNAEFLARFHVAHPERVSQTNWEIAP